MTLAITKDLLSSVFDDSVSYLPDSLRCEGIVFQEKDLSGGELFVVTAKVPSDTLVESALSKGATLVLAPETFRELNSGDSLSVIYCEDPRNASEKICLAYYSLVQTPLYGVVGGARDRELLAQFLAHLLPGRGQTIDQLGENLLLETISAISRLHDQFDWMIVGGEENAGELLSELPLSLCLCGEELSTLELGCPVVSPESVLQRFPGEGSLAESLMFQQKTVSTLEYSSSVAHITSPIRIRGLGEKFAILAELALLGVETLGKLDRSSSLLFPKVGSRAFEYIDLQGGAAFLRVLLADLKREWPPLMSLLSSLRPEVPHSLVLVFYCDEVNGAFDLSTSPFSCVLPIGPSGHQDLERFGAIPILPAHSPQAAVQAFLKIPNGLMCCFSSQPQRLQELEDAIVSLVGPRTLPDAAQFRFGRDGKEEEK